VRPEERCACGRPLHYTDPKIREMVQRYIDALGPDVKVTIDGRSWLVQRHYIALHGLSAIKLQGLGFPEA
jgi:hypothetical protein